MAKVIKLHGTMDQSRFLQAISSRNTAGAKPSSCKPKIRYLGRYKMYSYISEDGYCVMDDNINRLIKWIKINVHPHLRIING
jgi:hypothetical protein